MICGVRSASGILLKMVILRPLLLNLSRAMGYYTPPPGYFKVIREILNKYNVLLITDEVQTGFGRTGEMFAIEHWDVEPDIMTMAKSLANGTPAGAFITNDRIASSYTRPGASTTGGQSSIGCGSIGND